jgi:hypothetical protein
MSTFPGMNGNARASVVNRTHRVVREQALMMRATQERKRSLWVPLAITSVLLPIFCYAFWATLDGYDLTPNGVPDAGDQLIILMLWMLPVTALALGSVWYRRSRGNQEAS